MKYIYIFSTILVIINSCEKPVSNSISCTNNTMPLPQMAKDYFLFKDGSYWVYENIVTAELDSFYVNSFLDRTGDNSQFKFGNKLSRCYEFYSYIISGNIIGNMRCVLYPNFPDNETSYFNQTFFIDEYNNALTKQIYTKLVFVGDSMHKSEVLRSILSQQDSIRITNTMFFEILSISNSVLDIDFAKQSYYARNIGLIQFTTNDNHTWALKRYHIVQ